MNLKALMSLLVFTPLLSTSLSCHNNLSKQEQVLEIENANKADEHPRLPPAQHFEDDFVTIDSLTFNTSQTQSTARSQLVWLATEGLVVEKGNFAFDNAQQNTSSIPTIERSVIPAFRKASFATSAIPASALVRELISRLNQYFAPYAIEFVSERPTSGDYTTVALGGMPDNIGKSQQNLLGIAPLDIGNRNANDIVFVFSENVATKRYDLQGLALTITHELAHSFGLAHSDDPKGIMAQSVCRCTQNFGTALALDIFTGEVTDTEQDDHAMLAQVLLPRSDVDVCTGVVGYSVAREGTTLSEESGCVTLGGNARYWRSEQSAQANGGAYLWTGATSQSSASNFARFALKFEQGGEYEVFAHIAADANASTQATYRVSSAEGARDVRINQSRVRGWNTLGTYRFNASSSYNVEVNDNTGESSSASKRVVIDAIKVLPAVREEEPEPETPEEPEVEPEPTAAELCELDDDEGPFSFDDSIYMRDEVEGLRCERQNEYYRFYGSYNCAYTFELEHDAENGNLGLMLYNRDRRALARSFTDANIERVVQGGRGTMYAAVRATSRVENTFELRKTRICRREMTCEQDDPFEPNDDKESAVRLFDNDAAVGITCGNEDHYRIYASRSCETRVHVDFDHEEGDIDVQINDRNDVRVASGRSRNDDEDIRFTPETPGFFDVRVYGYRNAQNDYRITLTKDCD